MTTTSTPAVRPRHPGRRLVGLLGPAFVAAVAYVDPGNVAANVSSGADYGYLLVWVLVAANLMAAVVQYLSAKLGLVTGRSLPELLGERMSRPARLLFWAQAEVVAAATDVAEVIGGAIALHILVGMPLVAGGVVTGAASVAILAVQTLKGQRTFERVVIALLVVITVGFIGGLVVAPVHWGSVAGGLVPRFRGSGSLVLAASMLGATVMPHAVYLHSALARDRHAGAPHALSRLLSATRWDVGLALALAGSVNIGMLVLAAATLGGASDASTIEGAYHALLAALGPVVAGAFAVGLLASGLASTSVGTYAGATIMAGLLRVRVPLIVRRVVTVIPALVILGVGIDPTAALVASQVVLSVGIPFAIIPLARLTSRREVMGDRVDGRALRVVAAVVTLLVVALNVALIALTVTGGA